MNREQIKPRIDTLRSAIAYSRYMQKHMSVGEGIMCQQEIAGWFAVLDNRQQQPHYTITQTIEDKVALINKIIITERWQNPNELI